MWFEVYMKKLKKVEAEGRAEAEANYEDGFIEDYDPVVVNDGYIDVDEIYWDDDYESIQVSFTIKKDKIDLAYVGMELDIPLEVLIDAVLNELSRNKQLIEKIKLALKEV